MLLLLTVGDSPVHPFSIAADDEDSLGYAEKSMKCSESEEDLTAVVSPR